MKKLIAAVLAVLCLAGCSAKEEPVKEVPAPAPAVTEEKPVEQPAVEEKPVQEIEIEVQQPQPEESKPEAGEPVEVPVILVEGLVGDAVGYSFRQPAFEEFTASDTMNKFYEELVQQLVTYANGPVNNKCLQDNCVASVYGNVLQTLLTGETLEITYECRVEFSNSEEGTVNVRTDVWNLETGEVEKK